MNEHEEPSSTKLDLAAPGGLETTSEAAAQTGERVAMPGFAGQPPPMSPPVALALQRSAGNASVTANLTGGSDGDEARFRSASAGRIWRTVAPPPLPEAATPPDLTTIDAGIAAGLGAAVQQRRRGAAREPTTLIPPASPSRDAGNALVTRSLARNSATLPLTPAPPAVLALAPAGAGSILDMLDAVSDKGTGNAVEAAIKSRFPHKLERIEFPDASSAPYRTEGRGTVIEPQEIGGMLGGGRPDIAVKSKAGMAMLLAELKPGNVVGVGLGIDQLANYIEKGNSRDNADLRARLGVKVFTPMLPTFWEPPKSLRVDTRRFRVYWMGPGLLLYKEIGGKKKKKKNEKSKGKAQQKKPAEHKPADKKPKGLCPEVARGAGALGGSQDPLLGCRSRARNAAVQAKAERTGFSSDAACHPRSCRPAPRHARASSADRPRAAPCLARELTLNAERLDPGSRARDRRLYPYLAASDAIERRKRCASATLGAESGRPNRPRIAVGPVYGREVALFATSRRI